MRGRSADLQMEGAALAGAGQRDRPRKGGKRTKASKAQELFEEEVKRLVKLIDVKLTLQGLRNVVEYEEALKSALASSASGTYGGMLVDVYVGVVSGSSPEAVKLGYEHVRRKLRGPSSAHVMALFATEDSDVEESSSDEEVGLPSRDDARLEIQWEAYVEQLEFELRLRKVRSLIVWKRRGTQLAVVLKSVGVRF